MIKTKNITVTVKTIPHPESEKAIDLVANIVVNQLIKEQILNK